jgi:hypothetical protein
MKTIVRFVAEDEEDARSLGGKPEVDWDISDGDFTVSVSRKVAD